MYLLGSDAAMLNALLTKMLDRFDGVEKTVSKLAVDIADMKGELTYVKGELSDVKGELTDVKGELAEMKEKKNKWADIGDLDIDDVIVGEGAFGVVVKAVDRNTKKVYALKRILLKNNEIDSSLMREMSILRDTNHPNIVRLERVYTSPGVLNLLMEFINTDLEGCIYHSSSSFKYSQPHVIKGCIYQILTALAFLHAKNIIHRDLKPENILVIVGRDGEEDIFKVADFGSARVDDLRLTPQMTTIAYRAPEVLLGADNYSCAVDMWAVGCIFAEMLGRQPFFELPSRSLAGQQAVNVMIDNIFSKLGTPTNNIWPGVQQLPHFPKRKSSYPIKEVSSYDVADNLDRSGIHLLQRLLCFDPSRRISAEEAIKHQFFDDLKVSGLNAMEEEG